MSRRLSIDLLTSVLGRGATALLLVLCTPLYVQHLGVEAYGLLAFYATTLATCMFLDQAISPAVVRQFAGTPLNADNAAHGWNTLRTAETVAVTLGLLLATALLLASGWIESTLLHADSLSRGSVRAAVRWMAVMLALQWPSFVYGSALAGLGAQTAANGIRLATALAQWLGGLAILMAVSPTVEALFAWQAACFLLQSLLLRRRVARALPARQAPPRWDYSILAGTWRFSAGSLVIGITGTVLTQGDKFAVSRHATLAEFAAYSLSFTMATLIGVFVAQPVMAVAYPHFTRLCNTDTPRLVREYRLWTQALVACTVPMVGTLIFYAQPLLALWMGSRAEHLAPALRYLPWVAAGSLFNVLMLLPFNLQMAHGWTALSVRKNLLLLPFFLLALAVGIPRWGPIVGAIAWLAVNLSYYLVEVPLMHRRLLPQTLRDWWFFDTLAPMALALLAFWLARTGFAALGWAADIGQCVLVALLVAAALVLTRPLVRTVVLDRLRLPRRPRPAP